MGSDINDLADDLVARDHGKDRSTPFVAGLVDVGMANTAIENVDRHVVGMRRAALDGEGSERRFCRFCRISGGLEGGFGLDNRIHDNSFNSEFALGMNPQLGLAFEITQSRIRGHAVASLQTNANGGEKRPHERPPRMWKVRKKELLPCLIGGIMGAESRAARDARVSHDQWPSKQISKGGNHGNRSIRES